MNTASLLLLAASGLTAAGMTATTASATEAVCDYYDMHQQIVAIQHANKPCGRFIPYLNMRFALGFPTNEEQAAICAKCPELLEGLAVARWPPCMMWIGQYQYTVSEAYAALSNCSSASSSTGDALETSAIRIGDGE
jgi:hypothetical protein